MTPGFGMFALGGGLMLVMGVIFVFMFALAMGIIIFTLVRSVKHERQNDRSPRISVPVAVVAKRTQVSSRHHTAGSSNFPRTYTTYYATFQLESGDRMELQVEATDYGWLVEGDRGTLTFQGTRFLGFARS